MDRDIVKKLWRWSAIATLIVFVSILKNPILASGSQATSIKTYVNEVALLRIVKEEVHEGAAREVANELSQYPTRNSQSRNPYGKQFRSLGISPNLVAILSPAFNELLQDNSKAKFYSFLQIINKGPVFRGMVSSRQFSGCVLVDLSYQNTFNSLVVTYKANPFKGCQNHPTDRYEMSFMHYLQTNR